MRIRGAKATLEEAGLDTEGMVESTAKLRALIMGIAKVDILEDDEKTFRSTYEIIRDIGKVWNDIDDEVQKSALLEALGGKMQSNIIASVLNNVEMLENVYNEAGDSLGVAMKEQEKWSKSLEASTGKIEAIFESISTKVFDSKSLKSILETFANILEVIDQIVSSGSGLTILFSTISGALGATKHGWIDVTARKYAEVNVQIAEFNALQVQGASAQTAYAMEVMKTNQVLGEYLLKQAGATAQLGAYKQAARSAKIETMALKTVTTALNVALNFALTFVISAIVQSFVELAQSSKKAREEFKEATDQYNDSIKELDKFRDAYQNIINSEDEEAKKIESLNDLRNQLSEKYKTEIDDIHNLTEAKEMLNKVMDDEAYRLRQKYLDEHIDQYEEAVKRVTDGKYGKNLALGGFVTEELNYTITSDPVKISDDIVSLFDAKHDIGTNAIKLDFGADAKNDLEYFEKLQVLVEQLGDLRYTRPFNEYEEALYDKVLAQYNVLKKEIVDSGDQNEVLSSAEARAYNIIYKIQQGEKSFQEWRDELYESARTFAGSDIIIGFIDKIIAGTNNVTSAIEKTKSPLAEILAELDKVSTQISEIKSGIKSTDEQFEDLLKTIKNNNDMDKFFSSSEIIEILEKYPSLNDAILETTYGYKIEADALEALRKAKLEEQKTALIAMQKEAENNLAATRQKLNNYGQELKGIRTVIQAKEQLAHVEAILANANMFTPGIGRDTNVEYYTAQRALLQSFLDAEEKAEEYQKQLDALDIELQILGKDSDDLSNSTNDAASAFNKQKAIVKDLNDEYKKAQDDINDLIELTMSMLKKEAEESKENLKTQLDNYKKLIDKKKELIDLEKDQYEFEKDLKEQNKNVLKLQQELDSLSIEGANYSLEDMKRKEELTEKLAEEQEKRTDFLYDHEVDVRKDALDQEGKNFEEQINTQTKAIEDYLKYEGRIRQEAIDLINGKTQEFYNDLRQYTLDYTTTSEDSFNRLWTNAYEAMEKYGNGQYDVAAVLAFLAGQIAVCENEMTRLENEANNAKNSINELWKDGVDGFTKLEQQIHAVAEAASDIPEPENKNGQSIIGHINSWNNQWKSSLPYVGEHHSGGIVGNGFSSRNQEVLAKLLTGELVVTQNQARNFMERTLPQLAASTPMGNGMTAPVFNFGDINISGNADQNIVNQIRESQRQLVNDAFDVLNRNNNIYNRRVK